MKTEEKIKKDKNGKLFRVVEGKKCFCLPSGYLLDQDGSGWKVTFNKFFNTSKLSKTQTETDKYCAQIMFRRFGFSPWMSKFIDRDGNFLKKKVSKEEKARFKALRLAKKSGFLRKKG